MSKKRTNTGALVIATESKATMLANAHLIAHNFVKFKHVTTKKTDGCYFVNYSGYCPIHKREHKGNHFYVIVPSSTDKPIKFACHDEDDGGVFLSNIITEDDLKCALRNPLPNFLSTKAFEWETFMHLVRIARQEQDNNAYAAASDYLNSYAVCTEKDNRVLLHVGKKKFASNPITDLDVDIEKWWRSRTILKGVICDADKPYCKDFVWHIPHDTEIWHDLDLVDLSQAFGPMYTKQIMVPVVNSKSWETL